jgi:hypothetical protein
VEFNMPRFPHPVLLAPTGGDVFMTTDVMAHLMGQAEVTADTVEATLGPNDAVAKAARAREGKLSIVHGMLLELIAGRFPTSTDLSMMQVIHHWSEIARHGMPAPGLIGIVERSEPRTSTVPSDWERPCRARQILQQS